MAGHLSRTCIYRGGMEIRAFRTAKAEPGMIIDFGATGRAIGIEMTAPTLVTTADLNSVLIDLGAPTITGEDLVPLQAA